MATLSGDGLRLNQNDLRQDRVEQRHALRRDGNMLAVPADQPEFFDPSDSLAVH